MPAISMKVRDYELPKNLQHFKNANHIFFSQSLNEAQSIFSTVFLPVSSWQKAVFNINATNLKNQRVNSVNSYKFS